MKKNVERTSSWFKKLDKEFQSNNVGQGIVYQTVLGQTNLFLKSQNPRSAVFRYYKRWNLWAAKHYYKYRCRGFTGTKFQGCYSSPFVGRLSG
jgi:hypothetical protein